MARRQRYKQPPVDRRRPKQRPAQTVPGSGNQLVGRRVLAPLESWLKKLHEQPVHGNRSLLADHVLIAHLLAFLSPALKSLRRIEDLFDHALARRRFGLPRVPRSTLSDAQSVFDVSLLGKIVADLYKRLGGRVPHEPDLERLLKETIAVDGTFFALAPRVTWALFNKPNKPVKASKGSTRHPAWRKGNFRVDVHFDVIRGVPADAVVTDGRTPEYKTLTENLRSGCFYLLDRAYHCYRMMADILAAGSDFLVRLRDDMVFEIVQEHRLSIADRLAGVLSAQTVRVTGHRGTHAVGDRLLRLVCIAQEDGPPIRLLTSRLDLEADLIGMIYRHRWQVELFFRWLKCLVNFRHFFSESRNGVALQIGAAIIGTLLIALIINDRPSSYDWAMMAHVMNGLLPLDDETLRIMAEKRARRARAADWQKAYRARKKTSA